MTFSIQVGLAMMTHNVKVTSIHWTFCVSLQTTIHRMYCAGS